MRLGNQEALGIHPEGWHQLHVFHDNIVVVACSVYVLAVYAGGFEVGVGIPYRFALAILRGIAFDLI